MPEMWPCSLNRVGWGSASLDGQRFAQVPSLTDSILLSIKGINRRSVGIGGRQRGQRNDLARRHQSGGFRKVRDAQDVEKCRALPVGGRDRKSTRLNSSHGYISY